MFASREDAGRQLARYLRGQGTEVDLVLGLPRGGVIVAAEVARLLKVPLDILIVRKIGHPACREFAVGALAETGVVLVDDLVVGSDPVVRTAVTDIVREEQERLKSYETRFHHGHVPVLAGKAVLLVDDGLATGATAEAAVLSARSREARWVGVAAPVGSDAAVGRLSRVADAVLVFLVDPDFDAVGRYYDEFPQTTDEEVLCRLAATV